MARKVLKRVQVPVSKDTSQALEALAAARGCSVASLAAEMLQEVTPIMWDMAKALELAKSAPARAMRHMSESLDAHVAQADQMRLKLEPKPKRKKAG